MKLKDFAEITMGQSPSGNTYNSSRNGLPFLQGKKTFGRLYPKIDTWTTQPLKIANKGDILMSVRAPVGDMNFTNEKICIGRGLCSITARNGGNKYLYYALLFNLEKLKLKAKGSVFEAITKEDLETLDINIHTELIQKKIENILSIFDEKIELNNQINDNLYYVT